MLLINQGRTRTVSMSAKIGTFFLLNHVLSENSWFPTKARYDDQF